MSLRRLRLGLTALALAGCMVGPNYERPTVPLPRTFTGADAATAAADSVPPQWWRLFGDPMLDERDHLSSPELAVMEGCIAAIHAQKKAHRRECCTLITLLEGMRPRNPSHQPDRQYNDVFFAVGESVPGTSESAIEQPRIAKEMALAGFRHLGSVYHRDYL